MRYLGVGIALLFISGCASAGMENAGRSVPVYETEGDVPCDFEVIQTIQEWISLSSTSARELDLAREEALGRAGAARGADGVIVSGSGQTARVETAPVVASGGAVAAARGRPRSISVEGLAIRCIDERSG